MKAEINNENKAKFLGVYTPYGQIWKTNNEGHQLKVSIGDICLNLKPLSQISDDDAIEVSRILFGEESQLDTIHKYWVERIKLNLRNQFGSNIFPIMQPYFSISWEICDYLRSKGYALPWLGLSVEEMCEAGWIRLLD